MASSAYDTYGVASMKKLQLSEAGVRMFNDDDDTKYVELKAVAGPSGQHVHTLPHSSGVVLNDQSTLALAKLSIVGGTAVDALANDDSFALYDLSATANKKISAADLKTFCASGGVPAGTDAEFIVYSGTTADSVPMSGHIALANNGATTIQSGVVTNAMVAGGAAIAYSKLSLNNSIVAGDLTTDSVTSMKIQDGGVTAIKLAADAVTSAKLADQSEVVVDNSGVLLFYANGGGGNRFKLAASGSVLTLSYSGDAGSTYSTVQTFSM